MSDPNAPKDPYAAGREPEQPDSSTPAEPTPYGAQPPAPAYGTPPPPPAYGAQPPAPAYGTPPPPPAYGAQPPASPYGDQPAPPAYGEQPPASPYGDQPAYGAAPPVPAYGYGGQPQGYGYPQNNLGVWSLVLGILGIVLACGFFAGIPAIIVGLKAKRAVAEGQANNAGMATAGIVMGWVATIGSLLFVIFVIIVAATGDFSGFENLDTTGY